jgi:hypothetical protein
MSKSYWLNDEAQSGNFSQQKQDSFEPGKAYTGIRLQKGVPLLDRDWNESEDIRRYAEVMLRKYYIGNGVPDENSFKITPTDPPGNDFRIAGGRCLVDGFEVENTLDSILYSDQEGVEALSIPSPSPLPRTDTVYLDVWIEEVTSMQDETLKNANDVRMETCIRHKVKWLVKVDEGSQGVEPEPFHHHYVIARFSRKSSGGGVIASVVDLRQTGLSLQPLVNRSNADAKHKHSRLSASDGFPESALVVDNNGNVGIGTSSPGKHLHIQGNGGAPFCTDGHDRPGLAITGDYPELDLFGSTNNAIHGPTIRMGSYNDDSGTVSKHWSIGTSGRNSNFLDIGICPQNNPNPHGGIRNYIGRTVMSLLENGNVGINTLAPTRNLEVNGFAKVSALEFNGVNGDSGIAPQPYGIYQEAGPWTGNFPDLVIGYHTGIKIGAHPAYHGTRFFSNAPGIGGAYEIMSVGKGDHNTRVNYNMYVNGNLYAGSRTGGAIDYAEYFEAKNGKEIADGTSIVLDGGKIRPAKKGETPMGVISAAPLIAGGAPIEWPGKYLRDDFGKRIMEEYKEEILTPKKKKIKKERQKTQKKTVKQTETRTEIVKIKGKYRQKEITETIDREEEEPLFKEIELFDPTGKKKIGKHSIPVMETYQEEIDVLDENKKQVMVGSGKFETKKRPKLNPDYDESKEYILRQDRPEWNCVGLLGQLPLRKGQPVAPSWIKIKDISKDVQLWLVR